MSLADFLNWFKPSYKIVAAPTCSGCAARQAHIEDLQQLLKSERDGYAILQGLLFQRAGYTTPASAADEVGEQKALRNVQTMSQRRRMAEQKEHEAHPDAKKEYWTRVQADYDKAGKLPTVEVDGG